MSATALADNRANCPVTGEVCPARQRAIRLFGESANVAELSPEQSALIKPQLDGLKLNARLTELTGQAVARNCSGVMDTGECPIAIELAASRPRQTIIDGLRGLMRRSGL